MGATHTPAQGLAYAKRFIYEEPLNDTGIADIVMNNAADRIYFAKAWSWSVGQLDTITLVNSQDDYTITDPADVLYLLHAEVLHPDGTNEVLRPVNTLMPEDGLKGIPRFIARTSATNLRVKPTPVGFAAATLPDVVSFYKKSTTRIVTGSNETAAASLPFPDEWFWVYTEFLLYYAYKFAQDPRAGSMQPARQGVSLPTGQLAVALDALEEMKNAEPGLIVTPTAGESGRTR